MHNCLSMACPCIWSMRTVLWFASSSHGLTTWWRGLAAVVTRTFPSLFINGLVKVSMTSTVVRLTQLVASSVYAVCHTLTKCFVCHLQTGKSFALNKILPAVAREHPRFGLGGDRELVVCHLNFEEIAGGQTFEVAVRRSAEGAASIWAAGGRVG